MKRFVWRLQRVLEVKTREEQFKRTELLRLTEKLAERRGDLLMRQRILQDIISALNREKSPGRLGAQEFFLKHAATNDEQIRILKDEIGALEAEQKNKTAEVLAVKRFKEGLDKLRTEAEERFLREHEKRQQKELDDRTTTSFARTETMKG